jgi:hypothetical protein
LTATTDPLATTLGAKSRMADAGVPAARIGREAGNRAVQRPVAHVPVYTWNLAGFRAGHGASGTGNRHVFGGLSDAAFCMVPLLEASRDVKWPWLN